MHNLVSLFIKIVGVFVLILTSTNQFFAQSEIPEMQLQSIEGSRISTQEVFDKGQPILLVFWATWCNHTSVGLTDIQDEYLDDWRDNFDLKIVAVSVDDSKTSNRAVTVANSSGWDFDVFLDVNGDFKRAMGVNTAPHVVLLNAEGKVVWQQPKYLSGDEEIIQEKLEELK